ncbi:MAG: BREX protein BrxB domain-containing protein [Pseudomonadota bacterium]
MSDWKSRLISRLEPLLRESDPRANLSSYHDMPYAIFQYPPEEEFGLRGELTLLKTRLEQIGKRVTVISLAHCLEQCLTSEGLSIKRIERAEQQTGLEKMADTLLEVLGTRQPLAQRVAEQIPHDANPGLDVVLMTRAGALFPFYRTSSLLEHLKGKVHVPGVLFYPGTLEGPVGLRFMGVLDAEHNYRPKIF